jgi:hypothetical protein
MAIGTPNMDADDDHAVANAGPILPVTLAQRLDLEALVNGDHRDPPRWFAVG